MHFDSLHWRQATLKITLQRRNNTLHFRFDRSIYNHLFKLISVMDTISQRRILLTSLGHTKGPHSSFNGVSLWLVLSALVDVSVLFSRNNEVRRGEAVPDTGRTQLALLARLETETSPCQLERKALWVDTPWANLVNDFADPKQNVVALKHSNNYHRSLPQLIAWHSLKYGFHFLEESKIRRLMALLCLYNKFEATTYRQLF